MKKRILNTSSLSVVFSLLSMTLVLFTSCIKPPEESVHPDFSVDDSTAIKKYGKLVVLNEGLFQQNNATLSQVNLADSTVFNQVYQSINHRKLGDTGNDMQVYGDKIYIVVHSSSYVEVLDKHSLVSVGRVELLNGNKSRLPRSLAFKDDEVWVSCYDGNVISFDTTAFSIQSIIKVGRNPEGLAVLGNKLFVANSGGLDSPNYDKTVSVIDLISRLETKQIEIGINPNKVVAAFGKIYVSSRGNHKDILSDTYVIDAVTEQVITKLGVESTSFALKNDTLIIASYNYNTSKSQVNYYDAINASVIGLDVLNLENLKTLFAVHVAPDGSIYCCDAQNFTSFGRVFMFKNEFDPIKILDVGLNPVNVLFIQ